MDTIAAKPVLKLGFGLKFKDLYSREGLQRLDAAFCADLAKADADLAESYGGARTNPDTLTGRAESDMMLALAPHVDAFVGKLFGITDELAALRETETDLAPLAAIKRTFVQRKAVKAFSPDEVRGFDGAALAKQLSARIGAGFDELAFARAVTGWLADADAHAADLDLATRYAAWAATSDAAASVRKGSILFTQQMKHDPMHLVPTVENASGVVPVLEAAPEDWRRREGFSLTDKGADLAHALDFAANCIHCYKQGRDSCTKGMTDRATGKVAQNPLGRKMLGCPLEERISEMIAAETAGHTVAALGMICIDNPMCAGTGHRICNDCMVSCVYQNQQRDPVMIPEIETRVLKDVLYLPWGFEIYSLFTRWNPFLFRQVLPAADTGYSVLVAGMGPAGYTLAQHLLRHGHSVVGIDGLKIEPVPAEFSGIAADGSEVDFTPVRSVDTLWKDLNTRITAGFGGVAEYGITVRWDKNFLTLIRLILERNRSFRLFGGVRFGSTFTFEDAAALGFDHVALCLGAGKPTLVSMQNKLAPGVRQASDFLMALQLTGAAHPQTIANLQIRLPVAVIGGGLTAVDSCTEALAYYPVQVEKFLARYEILCAERGEKAVRERWNPANAEIADEFLAHARAIREERKKAAAEKRAPRILELLRGWGGVTLVYRRKLTESPAYRNNHEEITKALEEGISIAEAWSPEAVQTDASGWASGLTVRSAETKAEVTIPARTVIVAAGTIPNVTLAREGAGGLAVDGKYFQALSEEGEPIKPETTCKPEKTQVLIAARKAKMPVSFFGDLHPGFKGNVVTAMASGRKGVDVVDRTLAKAKPNGFDKAKAFKALAQDLRPTVARVNRLTPNIVEVVLHAPAAARNFKPGQFFRLQNFAETARRTDSTILAMEGVALTGAWVDLKKGELGLIAMEMGGSSDLVATLRPGEPVVTMGPTGAPTELPKNGTVLLAGGGLGNAVLFSIGRALKDNGCRVLYFAAYKRGGDRFKVPDILAASDVVVWCCDIPADFTPERPDDKTFTGNIVQAMAAYGEGKLGEVKIPLMDVERIIVIGSAPMMNAVKEARHGVLEPFLKPCHHAVGSINAPMQCMMKEICGQCLQRQVDPATGEEKIVFTCAQQDQDLDRVDFGSLRERLSQNAVQETVTRLWIDRELRREGLRK